MALAVALHVLGATVWVGGMFFAYVCLRPVAAAELHPPERLRLWSGVFGAFFLWVWGAVALLLGTGYWMLLTVFGGFANAGIHIHLMQGLGIVMVIIFAHVFFAPFRRLRVALATSDYAAGGAALARIRQLVAINLVLGLLVVVIASGGRYL